MANCYKWLFKVIFLKLCYYNHSIDCYKFYHQYKDYFDIARVISLKLAFFAFVFYYKIVIDD